MKSVGHDRANLNPASGESENDGVRGDHRLDGVGQQQSGLMPIGKMQNIHDFMVLSGNEKCYTLIMNMQQKSLATFGSGCFWCSEAIFNDLKGVLKVTSGYAGGTKPKPTYEEVCTGQTGHAEVINIEFDPGVIAYEQLLEVFFLTHNPTTPNRQGNDVGPQYRSVVFYHDEAQRVAAEKMKTKISADKIYDGPIVTSLEPFPEFYAAEDYHQNYFAKNPDQPYCQVVIDPKVAKFRKKFVALRK